MVKYVISLASIFYATKSVILLALYLIINKYMNNLYRISSLSISKVYIVKYVIFLASIFYCVIELASI